MDRIRGIEAEHFERESVVAVDGRSTTVDAELAPFRPARIDPPDEVPSGMGFLLEGTALTGCIHPVTAASTSSWHILATGKID